MSVDVWAILMDRFKRRYGQREAKVLGGHGGACIRGY